MFTGFNNNGKNQFYNKIVWKVWYKYCWKWWFLKICFKVTFSLGNCLYFEGYFKWIHLKCCNISSKRFDKMCNNDTFNGRFVNRKYMYVGSVSWFIMIQKVVLLFSYLTKSDIVHLCKIVRKRGYSMYYCEKCKVCSSFSECWKPWLFQ